MNEIEQKISDLIYDTIQYESNNTDRTLQDKDNRLGISSLGQDRKHALLKIRQVAETDETDSTAAWIGTVLGEAIENALAKKHPTWVFQSEVNFHLDLPEHGMSLDLPGHPDIIVPEGTDGIPAGVYDLKSKAEMESVRKYGQTTQQKFQVHAYAKAAMDAGVLDASKPVWVGDIYYDRAARGGLVERPHVIAYEYDPSVLDEIRDWLGDVVYAVVNGEDLPSDMPRDWNEKFSPYASLLAQDTDVEGLIEDPTIIEAIDLYKEAQAMESKAKHLKNIAQVRLKGVNGSTGQYAVRWVQVNGGEVSYTREPYQRLSITKVKPGKR